MTAAVREPSADVRQTAYYQARIRIAEELVVVCRSAYLEGIEIEYGRAGMGDPLRYIWKFHGFYIVNADLLEQETRLQEFIDACCVLEDSAATTAEELYKAYCAWRGTEDVGLETLQSAIASRWYNASTDSFAGIGLREQE